MTFFLKHLIQLLAGLFLIVLTFWYRLIRTPKPQLFEESSNYNYYIIMTFSLSILFLCLLIFISYKMYYPVFDKKSSLLSNHYMSSIYFTFNTYIISSPEYLYTFLTKNLNLQPFLEYPASYFTANLHYPKLFVILFYFFPTMLLSIIFISEIILYQHLFVFYHSLFLVVIVLFAKLIIFIFRSYSFRRVNHYELFLSVVRNKDGAEVCLKGPKDVPQHIPYERIVNNYNNMFNYYVVYYSIYSYMCEIDSFNNSYINHVRLFNYSCFFVGWFCMFLFLCFKIFSV